MTKTAKKYINLLDYNVVQGEFIRACRTQLSYFLPFGLLRSNGLPFGLPLSPGAIRVQRLEGEDQREAA